MSYFNHPVKVAVFQAAVVGLVERLIRKAGKTDTVQIQVLFTGDQACAVWGYIRSTVRGTIKLPALKEGSVIDREKANRWVAYVIHETWHIIFTSSDQWQNFCARFPGLRKNLANALEDARIERSGMELGYADGFKIVGKDLLGHMLQTGGMNVNPNDPRQIPWVFAVGCRGYGVPGERRLLSALDPRIAKILAEAKAKIHAVPADATPFDGTRASCDIALWVYGELQKLSTEPAQPPVQPPINPGPKGNNPGKQPRDDQPKSDDVSEREPEDAEGQDYSDEPQDGHGSDDDDGTMPNPGAKGGDSQTDLRVGDKVKCPDGTKGVISAINGNLAEVSPL